MKKIWAYIAMAFAGFSAGLIAMYKLMGDTVKVEVKKIKNKRVGSSTTTIPINIESQGKKSRRDKESKGKQTRGKRKQNRLLRKNKK